MIIILRNYQRKQGINTITGIIRRWAPASENDTDSYIRSVSQDTKIPPDERIDMTDSRMLIHLLEAIIRHENGSQPYGFEVFVKALELAGS